MQNILMKFDPATGKERPYPSHAAQWRNWHGVAAWLFDPWTGKRRNAYDVGSDVHGLLIVPAGTLGGDTGCGASKQNKHEAGNDAQWPEPLWWEVSMDDNYCTPLAAILRKAQGCIYRGTDEFIDVGGEVSELRRICDNQRATISRLRDASLRGELAAKQARIDELMQEYCPEEMTPDQLDTWARHQQLSPLSPEAREWIEAELAKGGRAA